MLDENSRFMEGCSLTSGFHSYAGDESKLRFRLLFTDRELLAKRPNLRSSKNKIISENRDKQGGKRQQQQDEDQSRENRPSERVNNNELLSHHSSFIIEQKQGRWEIEAEIGAKYGRRGCKMAELLEGGGLRLRLQCSASTCFSCKLPINGTSPTGCRDCRGCSQSQQDERGASSRRVNNERPQNKEEGESGSLEHFQSQPSAEEADYDGIHLSPSWLNGDKCVTTVTPTNATRETTKTTMRERAFNWKDTATVTSDSDDRQRTLARKLPYEIRNQQLEHCNHHYSFTRQHGNAWDFSSTSGADMDLSCGRCITGCCLFDGGNAVKELLRAADGAQATREGPIRAAEELDADREGVERTDWYQDCLLNGKRDLAFSELASVAASAGFADHPAATTTTDSGEWPPPSQLGDGKLDDAIDLENSGRAPRPNVEILYVLMEIMESSGILIAGRSQLKLNAKSRTDTGAHRDATDGLIAGARSNWDKLSRDSVAVAANATTTTNDDDDDDEKTPPSQQSRDRELANNAVKMELKRPGDSVDMDDTDDRGDKGASMIVAEIAAGASDRLEPSSGRKRNNESHLDTADSQTNPDRAEGSLVATGDTDSHSAGCLPGRQRPPSVDTVAAGPAKVVCLAVIALDRLNRSLRLKPNLNELISVDIYNELELYQAAPRSRPCAARSPGGSSDRSGGRESESGLEQRQSAKRRQQLQQRHPLPLPLPPHPHHRQRRRPNASREGVLALLKLPLLYQLKLAVAEPALTTAAVDNDAEMRHRGLGGVSSSRRRCLLTKEEAEHALSLIYNKLLNKELALKRLQATSRQSGSNKWFMMGQEIPEKTATAPPFISPLNGNQLIMLQFDFHFASHFNNDCGNLYVKYKLLLKDNPASKWKLTPRTKGVGAKQENSSAPLLLDRRQQRQPQISGSSSSIKLNVAHDNDDHRGMPKEIDMNYYVEATKTPPSPIEPSALLISKRAAGRNQAQISHQEPANEGLADTKTNAANTNADTDTNTNTNTNSSNGGRANTKQLASDLDASTSRLGSGNPIVVQVEADKSIEHSRLTNTQQPNQPAVLLEGSTVTSRPDGVGRFQFGCLERLVFEVASRQDGAAAAAADGKMNTETANAYPAAVNRLKRRLAANKAPRLISSLLAPLDAQIQKSLESPPNNNEIDNFLASGDRYDDLDNNKKLDSSSAYDKDDDSVKRANYATKLSLSSLSTAALATPTQIATPVQTQQINGSKAASPSIQANKSDGKSRFNSERNPPDQVDGGIGSDNNHEINMLDKPALTPAKTVHDVSNKTSAGPSGIERRLDGGQPRRGMKESVSFPGKSAEIVQADDEQLELLLLLEFYSSDFYHDKLQGWSHLSLPICLSRHQAHSSCCVLSNQNDRLDNTDLGCCFRRQRQAALAMPTAGASKCNRTRHVLTVIRPELQSIRDKLRYYLIGELPSSTPTIESVSSTSL